MFYIDSSNFQNLLDHFSFKYIVEHDFEPCPIIKKYPHLLAIDIIPIYDYHHNICQIGIINSQDEDYIYVLNVPFALYNIICLEYIYSHNAQYPVIVYYDGNECFNYFNIFYGNDIISISLIEKNNCLTLEKNYLEITHLPEHPFKPLDSLKIIDNFRLSWFGSPHFVYPCLYKYFKHLCIKYDKKIITEYNYLLNFTLLEHYILLDSYAEAQNMIYKIESYFLFKEIIYDRGDI